ncbi:hypothetical protein Bb109J_c3487 [Bdellovibrio bacteriovorus]|nr:hypothetical protein Bb109J_c3487 [Bdellovibrio bacteriovorus]
MMSFTKVALIFYITSLSCNVMGNSACVERCQGVHTVVRDLQAWHEQYNQCVQNCTKEEKATKSGASSFVGDVEPEDPGGGNSPTPSPSPSPTPPDKPGTIPDGPATTAEENPPPAQQCREDYDAEVGACEQATLKAASSCDENGSGLSAAMNAITEVSVIAGQRSAAGIQESCSKMGRVAQAANVAVMGYRQLCGTSVNSCVSACSAPLIPKCSGSQSSVSTTASARTAMAGNLSSCQGFSTKMTQAAAAAQNFATLKANSEACAMLSNGTGGPDVCATDPTAAGCAQQAKMDCSHPDMALNRVCICSKTPTAPECMNQKASEETIAPYMTSEGRKIGKPGSTAAIRDQVGFAGLQGHAQRPASGPDYSVDGRQGTGASLGSPNLQGRLQKRLKGAKPGPDTNILMGTQSASTKKDEPEKTYEKVDLENQDKEKTYKSLTGYQMGTNPDLEKFLPKPGSPGAYRGLAGNGAPSGIDGITGPHSNIWLKVKNRYEAVKHSLLP